MPQTPKDVTHVYPVFHHASHAWYSINLIDVLVRNILEEPHGVKGYVRMRDQTAMKASAPIHQLSFTAVLFAGIIVASTVLEFMAGQNSCPWLQLTQPLEGGEGSDSDMSFATSAMSPEHFTTQQSMSSSFDFEFETTFSTPIPPFPTHDASSQTLSFAEALHRTQVVDHGTEATNFNAETQPQYCSLDMLSDKSLPLRQRPVDAAEGFAFLDASETCSYYEQGQMDRLPSRKIAGPSSTLLLTYVKGEITGSQMSIYPLTVTQAIIWNQYSQLKKTYRPRENNHYL